MKKLFIQNATKCLVLGIGFISIIGMTGCASKKPEEYSLKEVQEELPDWYMNPKNAMGQDYICEIGSDRTRTGAILEGKENLMALIETEVKYRAQTRRDSTSSQWRSKTDFRSEGILKKATIQKYKFGPDGKLYVLLCVDKNDIAWESW